MHLSILKAVNQRYETPFFNALKKYSQKPTAMFHALPISHSATIVRSHWIKDMGEFYGQKVFEAETSATTGGSGFPACNPVVPCETVKTVPHARLAPANLLCHQRHVDR